MYCPLHKVISRLKSLLLQPCRLDIDVAPFHSSILVPVALIPVEPHSTVLHDVVGRVRGNPNITFEPRGEWGGKKMADFSKDSTKRLRGIASRGGVVRFQGKFSNVINGCPPAAVQSSFGSF